MQQSFRHPLVRILFACAAGATLGALSCNAQADEPAAKKPAASVQRETPSANPKLDRSGRKRVGTASVYAPEFAGRKMADGERMDPQDDNAASKTLPFGTEAKVTNLETGRSARVTVQDRGPYVKGRIVDLSPKTARRIGLTPKQGVAKVEVAPITVPLPDGGVKPGVAAHDDAPSGAQAHDDARR